LNVLHQIAKNKSEDWTLQSDSELKELLGNLLLNLAKDKQ